MQFCNTSLRRRGQRSVALNHNVVARRPSTNHGTQQSALTQKLRQNTSYLQLGGVNIRLYTAMTIFAQRFNICSSKFETEYGAFRPARVYATGNSDCWSFCCKCKHVDSSRQQRKDKLDVISEICNLQQNAQLVGEIIPRKSHKFEQKSRKTMQISTFFNWHLWCWLRFMVLNWL